MFTVPALVLNLLWSIFHMQVCPYFATRGLRSGADIVFCPYNYLIDPVIRKSVRPLYTEDIIYSNIVWTVYFIHQCVNYFLQNFPKKLSTNILTKLFVIVHVCSIFFSRWRLVSKTRWWSWTKLTTWRTHLETQQARKSGTMPWRKPSMNWTRWVSDFCFFRTIL